MEARRIGGRLAPPRSDPKECQSPMAWSHCVRTLLAANSSLRQSARRRCSIANALRASRSEMILSRAIQRALDAQHRGQDDHDIAVGHQQIAGSSLRAMNVSTPCPFLQIRSASSRGCRRSSTGSVGSSSSSMRSAARPAASSMISAQLPLMRLRR